jgi:hypothetical protein
MYLKKRVQNYGNSSSLLHTAKGDLNEQGLDSHLLPYFFYGTASTRKGFKPAVEGDTIIFVDKNRQ